MRNIAYCLLLLILPTSVLGDSKFTPVLSLLLLDEDTYLQRILTEYKNPDTNHIFIAAHRGGKETDFQDQIPGNSIANINNAVSKGFDIYESDIEILGDDTLMVFHDEIFDNLTNTNVVDDRLDNANLAYAKSLRLTYDNAQVSTEMIPTLAEFLAAGRGKIMFKFDLKTGVDVLDVIPVVLQTETSEQVLLRTNPGRLADVAVAGYDTQLIMPQMGAGTSLSYMNSILNNFALRAISFPSGAVDPNVVDAAISAGLVVETHEATGVERENSWISAIGGGYRQIHSFKPSLLLSYLRDQNRHW